MAFFNIRIVGLVLYLSITLFAFAATAHTSTTAPSPSPPISLHDKPSRKAHEIRDMKMHMFTLTNEVDLFRKTVVSKKLRNPNSAKQCRCLTMCHELYTSASENLKHVLDSMVASNFSMVNHKLTSFTTDISACDQCMAGSGPSDQCSAEFKKFDCWALGIARDLIAKSAKYCTLQYLETRMAAAASAVGLFHTIAVPRMSRGGASTKGCRCLAVCQELYRFALDDLKKGLEGVGAADIAMVKEKLTSFTDEITSCDDCLVESDKANECPGELRKFDGYAISVGRELLAKSATVPHGV